MRFIGLRHGQSTYNLRHLCNDDPAREVRLTGKGIAQAGAAIAALRQAGPTAIHCSPLPRTVQTARIVNAALHLPLHLEPALADIRTGFDGRPVAAYLAAIAHDPLHARHNGGESLQDHCARVSACLQRLAEQGRDNLLLVAHEETLRVFKAWAEGLPLQQVIGLPFGNCEPYLFDSGNTREGTA
jgi:probable phosphoglycerate mutase